MKKEKIRRRGLYGESTRGNIKPSGKRRISYGEQAWNGRQPKR